MNNRVLLAIALVVPLSGHSYELSTHARLTNAAYLRSILAEDTGFLSSHGINSSGDSFGLYYFDVSGGSIERRSKNDFEEKAKRMPSGINPLSVPGWLMRGAIREDDYIGSKSPNPQDDPYILPDIIKDNRPLHHFYDPRNDQGLRVGLRIGQKAPDWGIGADDVFTDENDPDVWRRNHFTVFDAREAMFRAITGMDKNGSTAIVPDTQYDGGREPEDATEAEATRKAYWATTFRALGDLVHLIQDMAQPQHTRNDPHAGSDDYEQPAGPAGHKSFYEIYINSRAIQGQEAKSNSNIGTLEILIYDSNPSYPIPAFRDYVSYFSAQHLEPVVTARKGMADYSNRGFITINKTEQEEYA